MTRGNFFKAVVAGVFGVGVSQSVSTSFSGTSFGGPKGPKEYPVLIRGYIYVPAITEEWDWNTNKPIFTRIGGTKTRNYAMAYVVDKTGYEQFWDFIEKEANRHRQWHKKNTGSEKGIYCDIAWVKADKNFVFSSGTPLAEVTV